MGDGTYILHFGTGNTKRTVRRLKYIIKVTVRSVGCNGVKVITPGPVAGFFEDEISAPVKQKNLLANVRRVLRFAVFDAMPHPWVFSDVMEGYVVFIGKTSSH
jgi:hypothetical protein